MPKNQSFTPPQQQTHSNNFVKNDTITVIKGIAIILMVIGHTMSPFGGFIYAFHIPLFFLVAGYCFKEKYCKDVKTFTIHRVKGLWWPFLKWNFVFIILHNALFGWGIYEDSYTLQETAKHILKTVFMTGSEQMLGGYWFLGGLFMASMASWGILALTKCRIKYLAASMIVLLLTCMVLNTLFPTTKPVNDMSAILFFVIFFISGFVLKSLKNAEWVAVRHQGYLGIGLLVLTLLISLWITGDMRTPYGWQLFIRYIGAVAGTVGLLILCKKMKDSALKRFFKFCGESTMFILTWHFVCFKLIDFILISAYNRPLSEFSQFPTHRTLGQSYWWLYALAGVAIPLLLQISYNLIKKHIIQPTCKLKHSL